MCITGFPPKLRCRSQWRSKTIRAIYRCQVYHCNAHLGPSATHCSFVQNNVEQCSAVQCSAVQCVLNIFYSNTILIVWWTSSIFIFLSLDIIRVFQMFCTRQIYCICLHAFQNLVYFFVFMINQGVFCHDQVSLGKFFAFFNLLHNLHMFLDIIERRKENKNSS